MANRFIRRTPLSTDEDLKSPVLSEPVFWLEKFCAGKFYQLPSSFSLNSDPMYKEGRVIGMDAASVATVWALQVGEGMSCIDICCAPGMKFSLMSDFTADVTGLDVSEHRLDVCHTLMRKFGYTAMKDKTYLMSPDWRLVENGLSGTISQFLRVRESRKRKKRQKRQRTDTTGEAFTDPMSRVYDRVLVDAECTHDGSARHTSKHEADPTQFVDDSAPMAGFWSRQSDKSRSHYDSEEKITALVEKQKILISDGFKLLKPGGLMVYSTCSLQPMQNEEVVRHLLESESEASMGELPFGSEVPAKITTPGMALFDPEVSKTSGQFIAVIRRIRPS